MGDVTQNKHIAESFIHVNLFMWPKGMNLFLPVLDLHQTVQYFPAPTSEPSAGLSAPDFLQKKYASFYSFESSLFGQALRGCE